MIDTIIGHDDAVAVLDAALARGNMPHAWLISGPRGIGKATLARAFIARLVGADHAARHRIASGTHGDVLEIGLDPTKREIPVAEARAAMEFLSLTPNESTRRVVLIDPAEALNLNAASALLKTLEEPPPSGMLVLVSHQPGALLPAVRSRCRKLTLKVPPPTIFDTILERIAPEVPSGLRPALAVLADGAPGEASTLYREGALDVYEDIVAAFNPTNAKARMALADSVAGKEATLRWRLFCRLLPRLLARAAATANGAPPAFSLTAGEQHILPLLAARPDILETHDMALSLLAEADAYNLNVKSVVLKLTGAS